MLELIDAVAGRLEFDYGWCRPVYVDFLGHSSLIKIVFSGDEDRGLDPGQQDAFARFWSSKERLLSEAEIAILEYYQSIRVDVRSRVPTEVAEIEAPPIEKISDLGRVVRLDAIFFPEDFGSGKRVAGLLADCSWDPSLGLAVRFEDESIVGVGPQDIVL